MSKLKPKLAPVPCPWCKKTPKIVGYTIKDFRVECWNERRCPVAPVTGLYRTARGAVAAWNRWKKKK